MSNDRKDTFWYENLYDTSFRIREFIENHLTKVNKIDTNDKMFKKFIYDVNVLSRYFIENKKGVYSEIPKNHKQNNYY